jgi:hypothetical protein
MVVFDKLDAVSHGRQGKAWGTDAAACAPTASATFVGLGGRPFPGPLKLHRGTAAGGVVAYQLDLGVLVEVGIGVELAGDEVVKLSGAVGKDKSQAVDAGVDQAGRDTAGGGGVWVVYARHSQVLAEYECEVECEVLVVGQAYEEGGRGIGGRLGVLGGVLDGRTRRGKGEKYLDIINDRVVAQIAPGRVARRRKGIWGDVEQGAAAGSTDVEGGDRDWEWLARRGMARVDRGKGSVQRVWSRKYRASPPAGALWTWPMPASQACRGRRRRAGIRSRRAWQAGAVACLARAREAVEVGGRVWAWIRRG